MEIRVKLKIKDVEIELSQDEATELQEMLGKLTGKTVDKTTYVYPWDWYHRPFWYGNNWTVTNTGTSSMDDVWSAYTVQLN